MAHTQTHTYTHSVGVLWTRDQPVVVTSTWRNTTFITRHRHPCSDGIRTSNPSKRAAADIRLRLHGHRNRPGHFLLPVNLSLMPRNITCFQRPFVHRCEVSFVGQQFLYVNSLLLQVCSILKWERRYVRPQLSLWWCFVIQIAFLLTTMWNFPQSCSWKTKRCIVCITSHS